MPRPDQAGPYDVLVSGGTAFDGTGAAPRRADVAVRDGRIVHVGASDQAATATTVLDATGPAVTPGFIDLHSHADFSVRAMPGAEACLRQGVTTLVTGNCGLSPSAPRAGHRLRGGPSSPGESGSVPGVASVVPRGEDAQSRGSYRPTRLRESSDGFTRRTEPSPAHPGRVVRPPAAGRASPRAQGRRCAPVGRRLSHHGHRTAPR
ncbi:amidohydrolase family protein [Streptomyces sp. Tue6028]|uniref:amidohydrolase family protein n=1 Tax=Streptomyces sp. Tue6028 TaxID=2036037 RepID=UPI003EC11CA5